MLAAGCGQAFWRGGLYDQNRSNLALLILGAFSEGPVGRHARDEPARQKEGFEFTVHTTFHYTKNPQSPQALKVEKREAGGFRPAGKSLHRG